MSFDTWKCHICGKERPDANISVMSKPIAGLPGATQNIRYCNDREECKKKVETFSLFDLEKVK